MRTAVYRLYPNRDQEMRLLHMLDGTRKVYNRLVEICKSYVEHHLALPSKFDLINMTTKIRHRDAFLEDVHTDCFRTAADRVYKAFASWSKRSKDGVGFPRFKSWKMFDSYTYSNTGSFDFRGKHGEKGQHGRLRLGSIGLVKYSNPFVIPGKCKIATVFRRHIGEHYEWFSAVSYEITTSPRTRCSWILHWLKRM